MKREVVKDRTTRSVERVVLDDGTDLHVKRILLHAHPLRALFALFGRNAARREARRLDQLRDAGVLAPEAVAVETRRVWGFPVELILKTRTLQGFRALVAGEEAAPGTAAALGAYVRELHGRGVFHDDLHRGNLLRDDRGTFALLDADRVRFRPAAPGAERWRGLLTVLRAFRALRDGPAWPAFLEAYGARDLGLDPEALRAAAEADLLRHLRARSRRAFRENPDFGPLRAGGIVWQVRKDYRPPEDPEAALRDPTAILKRGNSSSVGALPDGGVLKVFHPRRLRSALHGLVSGSRARRAFRNGHLLDLLGIPTARPLAFAEADRSLRHPRAYLICERVSEASPGTAFLAAVSDRARATRFLADAGGLVGRLHRAGFSHRDLKGRNLLRTTGDRAVVIDLDGLKDWGVVPPDWRRHRDLLRLLRTGREVSWLGRREALIFLRAYQQALGGGRAAPVLRALLRAAPASGGASSA